MRDSAERNSSTSVVGVTLWVAMCSVWCTPASAIPVFARIYDKPCGACHTVFPQLNPQGENFRAHGFHGLPPAVQPLQLGSLINVPGTLPLALYFSTGENVSRTDATGESASTRSHFNLQFLSLLVGGELGAHLAFLLDYELLETAADSDDIEVNSLPEQAYLVAHAEPWGSLINLKAGWFELPVGTSPRVHRLSAQPYLVYAQSACALLERSPPHGNCEDTPVLSQTQIGAELNGLQPTTGIGWAVGLTNGSNNRLHDRASKDVYLRVSKGLDLHRVGFFLYYSPDVFSGGPADQALRLGPDVTFYTRRVRITGQFLANYESDPTGHSQDLWYYAGIVEGTYRLTRRIVSLLRGEYVGSERFDDTGRGGSTRARRRLWSLTAGGQLLVLQNVKLVAEVTYGENHERISGHNAGKCSATVRLVSAVWPFTLPVWQEWEEWE